MHKWQYRTCDHHGEKTKNRFYPCAANSRYFMVPNRLDETYFIKLYKQRDWTRVITKLTSPLAKQ